MTAKHRDPEYKKNARMLRQAINRRHRLGLDVTCWRCGRPIEPEQSWDVGHVDRDGGHAPDNLAPEHRYKSAYCIGNRADGGRLAHRTRRKPAPAATPTANLLPW